MRPIPSVPVHPRAWCPEARSRANPGSGGRPTDTARIVHGPFFHSEARFPHTGARQDPCAGGRTTDTADSYPWFSIEARPYRADPCPRSHTRPGCRPLDTPGFGRAMKTTPDARDKAAPDKARAPSELSCRMAQGSLEFLPQNRGHG